MFKLSIGLCSGEELAQDPGSQNYRVVILSFKSCVHFPSHLNLSHGNYPLAPIIRSVDLQRNGGGGVASGAGW